MSETRQNETPLPAATETPAAKTAEPKRSSRRKFKIPGFCLGCLLGGALVLVAMVALGVMSHHTPERFPSLVRALFGADRPDLTGPGTPTLTYEQIQAIRGVKPVFEIVVSDNDINSYLVEHPEALGLPKGFAAPRVEFADQQMLVSLRTKVLLWPVRVKVYMRPQVIDGRVSLEITEVQAGRVSLPGEFRQQIRTQMERVLTDQLSAAGVQPQAVTVGEGKLTVTAQLQPSP